MKFFPIFINLENKLCVIVGGGKVAERKLLNLVKYPCRIRVVSPTFTDTIESFSDRIELIKDRFKNEHIEGADIVFACTDDKDLNIEIRRKAQKFGALTNVITSPDECDFIVPAILKKGDITVAISTGGTSPALSHVLKEKIDEIIDERYILAAKVLKLIREKQLTISSSSDRNREKFYKFLERFFEVWNDKDRIESLIEEIFNFRISLKK